MNTLAVVSPIAARVIQFFCDNPDEVLTPGDIAVKFDCRRLAVHSLLGSAVKAGYLIRRECTTNSDLTYCKGNAVFVPGSRAGIIDLGSVPIRTGIPIPRRQRSARYDWPEFLGKLAVGDSVELPYSVISSLAAGVREYSAASGRSFTRRVIDRAIHVWRVS